MQPLHVVTKTSVLHVLSNMAQKSATNYPVSCFPQNTFAISQMQKNIKQLQIQNYRES
jgi:hypothetical protein